MKIKSIRKTLRDALVRAENFIGKDLDLPVLSGILLETKNNFLEISATNINTSFLGSIPVNVQKEGKVVVLGDVLTKAISNIEGDEVELFLDGNVLKVVSEKNQIEINTLDYSDFPSILTPDNTSEEEILSFDFSAKNFLEGINSVNYATSKSTIKPELASIYFYAEDEFVYFVATDGFRLAEKRFKVENIPDFKMLIPNESASLFVKTLTNLEDDKIKILFFGKQIFIQNDDFIIFSRLTDGSFVDYRKIIPKEGEVSVIFLKQDFLNLSKLANIFSDDFNQINFDIKNGKVEIETKNKIGKNKSLIEAAVDGNDLNISFNHKNILDAFNAIHTDSVEFLFNKARPLLIKGVGDDSFKYIVMPLSK